MAGGPGSFALVQSWIPTSQLLFCAVASASLSPLPAQPGNQPHCSFRPRPVLAAQIPPPRQEAPLGTATLSYPSFLGFVTEEFLFQRFRVVGVGSPTGGGVDVRARRRKDGAGRKGKTLGISFLELSHPQSKASEGGEKDGHCEFPPLNSCQEDFP